MEGHKPHSLKRFPKYYQSMNKIIHYTCNAPTKKILKENNITPIGDNFGCVNDTEVLEIPMELYLKKGFRGTDKEDLTINCEKLMRNLSRK
jgi:hypothetical protein